MTQGTTQKGHKIRIKNANDFLGLKLFSKKMCAFGLNCVKKDPILLRRARDMPQNYCRGTPSRIEAPAILKAARLGYSEAIDQCLTDLGA